MESLNKNGEARETEDRLSGGGRRRRKAETDDRGDRERRRGGLCGAERQKKAEGDGRNRKRDSKRNQTRRQEYLVDIRERSFHAPNSGGEMKGARHMYKGRRGEDRGRGCIESAQRQPRPLDLRCEGLLQVE